MTRLPLAPGRSVARPRGALQVAGRPTAGGRTFRWPLRRARAPIVARTSARRAAGRDASGGHCGRTTRCSTTCALPEGTICSGGATPGRWQSVQRREFQLSGGLSQVPQARHFTTEALTDVDDQALIADAVAVVSELTTNALLHGRPPVGLAVQWDPAVVRIEVSDGSAATPVRGRPDTNTMTGRGIRLVEALAQRWGVEPSASGKTVWCELVPGAADDAGTGSLETADPVDVDHFLATWSAPLHPGNEPTFTVVLGDVPTDLLLAAKSHVDNLLREFALLSGGAAVGSTSAIPPDLAELIEQVAHRFTEARQGIKRQALAAAAAGEPRTHLSLTLPLSAADAGDA